ncbi:MAG: response regulator [Alphaproteobacteria bacterium]|nr:response regulator [Alphaproteobacteria bacterium]
MPERLQVLLIDDDATDRMALRRHLQSAALNSDVHEADTGAAGIALLRERPFDCVFVDYRLPDMEGTSLLQAFYDIANDLMPAPFVMLTGQGGEAVMAEALRWGAHDYIVKDHITGPSVLIALSKAREVFELKRARHSAEDKLRQAQKMDAVGQLTSGIAHDFNNLLTVILGNTRIMRRRLAEIPAAQGTAIAPKVDAVESAAQRGADLVRHLMVFSRQQELKSVTVDIGTVLSDTVALLERTLGKGITLALTAEQGMRPVHVDATLLENAVINISVNARDAMPQGGTLSISARQVVFNDRGHVLISIADTGTGMPEHVRERIFEPFFTTKPAGEGTGLGLAMVYGFIRQTGGHIEVDSEAGRGTTFRIYLPQTRETLTNKEVNHAAYDKHPDRG